ncbi:hypothetical protein BAE44_0000040 [Dichanthelium oligosanthes]|uniref:USP domain-containing protein n=1 Tax=Dichanthelium oligosanthes TaxID=888268 RepID=A0A1E5WNH0_9POAL|nr:hypothetical protein BAE44_0000040 [Dichanthelium oligosanthes]
MSGGSGDKMFLFGSFTEDETKLFQGQPLKSPTKSGNKTWELPEIQFGSLNFSVLSLQKAASPNAKCVVLPAKSADAQSSPIKKENAHSNKKEAVGSTFPNGGPVLANGCSLVNVSLNNGVLENMKKVEAVVPPVAPVVPPVAPIVPPVAPVVTPVVPAKNISNAAPHAVSEVDKDGINSTQSKKLDKEKEITENGSTVVDTPAVAAPTDEAVTGLNKKASENMPLLPHGFEEPEQEDAQEFLSFAMNRMHDELLKLNGNGSNSKEGMVVSSADDDAWETVGRKNKSAIGRKYELVATITHHGRDPYRGHYTAHAKHANGQWLRFDDDAVAPVGVNEVLHDQAYVLFYKQI